MEAHFEAVCPLGEDHRKYQMKTNFWWCIDTARNGEDVGDWIAFVGAADRQNAFKRVIESDYKNWWMKKSAAEREQDYKESFR